MEEIKPDQNESKNTLSKLKIIISFINSKKMLLISIFLLIIATIIYLTTLTPYTSLKKEHNALKIKQSSLEEQLSQYKVQNEELIEENNTLSTKNRSLSKEINEKTKTNELLIDQKDREIKDLEEIIQNIRNEPRYNFKTKRIALKPGTYIVGEDLPEGTYNIKPIIGIGVFSVYKENDSIHKAVGNSSYTEKEIDIKLDNGDKIKVNDDLNVEMDKVD